MTLDPDLIRAILDAYEKLPYGGGEPISIEGYTDDQVNYHQELLLDEDYIKASVTKLGGGSCLISPQRLTYQGHEFLNASRDDVRWERAKTVMQKSGGFVLDVMKSLLITYLREQLLS